MSATSKEAANELLGYSGYQVAKLTPAKRRIDLRRAEGSPVNLSTLTMSAHTGTHIDAPHHVADNAATVDGLDLRPYWGRAQVVSVKKEAGLLLPDDFAGVDLRAAPRLLIHSAASHADPTQFLRRFVFPGPALAEFLAEMGIVLFGTIRHRWMGRTARRWPVIRPCSTTELPFWRGWI